MIAYKKFHSLKFFAILNCALDLRALDVDVAISEGCSSSGEDQDEPNVKTTSSMASTSDTEPDKTIEKSDSQWKGFLRKLKKGPNVHFQTFHPTIPHILSIKKLSRRRTNRGAQSLPALPPHIDADLYYCFETSWKNFTLSDLEEITNNFSHGNCFPQTSEC